MTNRAGRAVMAAGIAGFAMSLAAPALAAGSPLPVARSAWFYTTLADQAGAPPGVVPVPVTEPTGVPKGDDAVAFTADQSGASSKETLLYFALPKATTGSTITAFTVSATLDPSPTAPNAAATKAPVMACLPTRGWSPGEAQDSSNEPTVDCRSGVLGSWKGSTVTFAIPKLAQSWVEDTNLGVALVNDPKNKTQPFQAVFKGGKAITATLAFRPPPPNQSQTPPPVITSHHHHAQGSGGASGGGGGGGSFNPPPVPTVNVPGGAGTKTVSTAGQSQSPVVAESGSSTRPKPLAVTGVGHASTLPPSGFWAAAACLLILLVGAGAALAPRHAVGPSRGPSSRLDRLLRDPERLASLNVRSQP